MDKILEYSHAYLINFFSIKLLFLPKTYEAGPDIITLV